MLGSLPNTATSLNLEEAMASSDLPQQDNPVFGKRIPGLLT
jgi:hypothetical protein